MRRVVADIAAITGIFASVLTFSDKVGVPLTGDVVVTLVTVAILLTLVGAVVWVYSRRARVVPKRPTPDIWTPPSRVRSHRPVKLAPLLIIMGLSAILVVPVIEIVERFPVPTVLGNTLLILFVAYLVVWLTWKMSSRVRYWWRRQKRDPYH